jgi:hypothetical protein
MIRTWKRRMRWDDIKRFFDCFFSGWTRYHCDTPVKHFFPSRTASNWRGVIFNITMLFFHPMIMPCSISAFPHPASCQQRLLEHPSPRNTGIQNIVVSPLNHRPNRPLFPFNSIQQSALSESVLAAEINHRTFSPRPINDASALGAVSPSTLRLG